MMKQFDVNFWATRILLSRLLYTPMFCLIPFFPNYHSVAEEALFPNDQFWRQPIAWKITQSRIYWSG